MIILHFHLLHIISLFTGRYELNKLTSLPVCGFIAQLVENRTGIAEVMKIYCDDHSSLSKIFKLVQRIPLTHLTAFQCPLGLHIELRFKEDPRNTSAFSDNFIKSHHAKFHPNPTYEISVILTDSYSLTLTVSHPIDFAPTRVRTPEGNLNFLSGVRLHLFRVSSELNGLKNEI